MNADRYRLPNVSSAFICVYLWINLAACAPQPAFTPFVPPSAGQPTSADAADPGFAQPVTPAPGAPDASETPAATSTPETPLPCTPDLDYVQDLTVPDGSEITAGSSIDKQWQVSNSGTCSWDSSYRLELIFGDAMGAPEEQALYPARAGTQATLQIFFTAPLEQGNYQSAWQAFDPDGNPFGDAVFMQIVVTP